MEEEEGAGRRNIAATWEMEVAALVAARWVPPDAAHRHNATTARCRLLRGDAAEYAVLCLAFLPHADSLQFRLVCQGARHAVSAAVESGFVRRGIAVQWACHGAAPSDALQHAIPVASLHGWDSATRRLFRFFGNALLRGQLASLRLICHEPFRPFPSDAATVGDLRGFTTTRLCSFVNRLWPDEALVAALQRPQGLPAVRAACCRCVAQRTCNAPRGGLRSAGVRGSRRAYADAAPLRVAVMAGVYDWLAAQWGDPRVASGLPQLLSAVTLAGPGPSADDVRAALPATVLPPAAAKCVAELQSPVMFTPSPPQSRAELWAAPAAAGDHDGQKPFYLVRVADVVAAMPPYLPAPARLGVQHWLAHVTAGPASAQASSSD